MLQAQLNTSSAQVQRDIVAISRDAMKEHARTKKVTMSAVATQVDIINALILRMNERLESEAANINRVFLSAHADAAKDTFLFQVDNLQKQGFDLSNVAKFIAITDKSHADFCAMYAVEKVFNLLKCLASKDRNKLNGYTKAMLVNLLEHEVLTIDECKQAVSLELYSAANRSKALNQKQIRNLYNSGKTTASTQVSSSRMCLRALNVCNVHKGSSKDEITFNSEAQYTQAVLNLLQMQDNSSAELDKIAEQIELEMSAKAAS
jgi:hypothetical protein